MDKISKLIEPLCDKHGIEINVGDYVKYDGIPDVLKIDKVFVIQGFVNANVLNTSTLLLGLNADGCVRITTKEAMWMILKSK